MFATPRPLAAPGPSPRRPRARRHDGGPPRSGGEPRNFPEIIAKKIWYRGADLTARDLFDFALVAEREPRMLIDAKDVLLARRTVVLEQIADREEALREDFAALDVLEFRPSFEQCVNAVWKALAAGVARPPHRAEQRRAGYRASRAVFSAQIGL